MPDTENTIMRLEPDEFPLVYRALRSYVEDLSIVLDNEPLSSSEREELLAEKKTAHRLSRRLRKFLTDNGVDMSET